MLPVVVWCTVPLKNNAVKLLKLSSLGLTLRCLLAFVYCTTFIDIAGCVKTAFLLKNISIHELISVITLNCAI